jgi:hypothetical protein
MYLLFYNLGYFKFFNIPRSLKSPPLSFYFPLETQGHSYCDLLALSIEILKNFLSLPLSFVIQYAGFIEALSMWISINFLVEKFYCITFCFYLLSSPFNYMLAF